MNYENTTLTKILNGINYSLNIANKALPIYNQTKETIKSGLNTYKNLKNNNSILNTLKLLKVKNQIKKDMKTNIPNFVTKKKINNINNPNFFI